MPPNIARRYQRLWDFGQEPRRHLRTRLASEPALESPEHVQPLPGSRHANVKQPAFLFYLHRVVDASRVRQQAFFESNQEHGIIFKTLGLVERYQCNRLVFHSDVVSALQAVYIGYQCDIFEEIDQLAAFFGTPELLGRSLQLLQVFHPLFAALLIFTKHRAVPAPLNRQVDELRGVQRHRLLDQARYQVAKSAHRVQRAGGKFEGERCGLFIPGLHATDVQDDVQQWHVVQCCDTPQFGKRPG